MSIAGIVDAVNMKASGIRTSAHAPIKHKSIRMSATFDLLMSFTPLFRAYRARLFCPVINLEPSVVGLCPVGLPAQATCR